MALSGRNTLNTLRIFTTEIASLLHTRGHAYHIHTPSWLDTITLHSSISSMKFPHQCLKNYKIKFNFANINIHNKAKTSALLSYVRKQPQSMLCYLQLTSLQSRLQEETSRPVLYSIQFIIFCTYRYFSNGQTDAVSQPEAMTVVTQISWTRWNRHTQEERRLGRLQPQPGLTCWRDCGKMSPGVTPSHRWRAAHTQWNMAAS